MSFEEVDAPEDAELRIGFQQNDGAWSTIGVDALTVPSWDRTMNFGWPIDGAGRDGLDTALHEIGHALGLHHAHQNERAGITWDKEAVYDYFRTTQIPPWTKEMTDHNVLNKVPLAEVTPCATRRPGASVWGHPR